MLLKKSEIVEELKVIKELLLPANSSSIIENNQQEDQDSNYESEAYIIRQDDRTNTLNTDRSGSPDPITIRNSQITANQSP